MPPSHRPYRPGRPPPPASRAAARRLRTARLRAQDQARGTVEQPQQAKPDHPDLDPPDLGRPDGLPPQAALEVPDDEPAPRSAPGPDHAEAPQSNGSTRAGDVGDAQILDDDLDLEEGAVASAPAARVGRRLLVLAALGAVTVALGGFAVWAGVQAHGLNSQPSAQNVALTNDAATSEVNGEVTSAVNTIFSYDYADLASTSRAAQRLLTGPAVQQYATLFRQVDQQAARNKLVLTTKVTSSGVELLQGDRARVLIFADQTDDSAASKQVSDAGAMLAVDAVRQGGAWKIDNIDTFTSSP